MRSFRLWILLFASFACGCGSTETETRSTDATQSVTAAPSKPPPPEWKVRGDALANKEDYQGAIAVYDAALKESPDNVEILLARAKARQYSGDFAGARSDCQAVLKLAPREGRAWLGEADGLLGQQDYRAAIAALDKAIECGLRDVRTYHTRGVARHFLAQSQEALADFDDAIRLGPEETYVRVERGAVLGSLGEHEKAIADFTIRIQAEPTDVSALYHRAVSYLKVGNDALAVADIEAAMKARPEDPNFPGFLGVNDIDRRKFVTAVAWLNKGIELDLKRRGLVVPAISPIERTDEDLEFGRAQVTQLLRDRPVLAQHIKEGDAMWNWAVRQFAGESAPSRFRWDPQPPTNHDGECVLPSADKMGAIRVGMVELDGPRTGQPLSFERTCATVVFECFNHASQAAFEEHHHQLLSGAVDAHTFAHRYMETEELTLVRTRRFFCQVFVPWATNAQLADIDAREWHFEEWLPGDALWRNRSYRADARWEHYLSSGHEVFAYGLAEREGVTAALNYFETQLARSDNSPTVRAWLCFGKANYIGDKDESAALSALDEAIRLNPRFVDAYVDRGMRRGNRQALDEAMADFETAIRLAPSDPRGYGRRANVHYQRGDFDAALADFNRLIELDPHDADAFVARSTVWRAKNDAKQALADLAKAIELQPDHADAYFMRTEILVLDDDPAIRNGRAAVQDATRACELTNWEQTTFILLLAAAHAEAGNRDEAVKWQKKAAEMTPEANRGPVEAVIPIYEAGETLRDTTPPPKAGEQAREDDHPAK